MLARALTAHEGLALRAVRRRQASLICRDFSSTAGAWQQHKNAAGSGPGGKKIRAAPPPKRFDTDSRVGRGFIDPRAPRRMDVIRNNPMYKNDGQFIDQVEHAMYCNAQREEDDDGFFFDGTIAPNDHMANDEDPFGAGFLTEDEMEFPPDYKPQPYIPGYVEDHIYFLYKERKWGIKQLCQKFQIASERVSAILALKESEPLQIAKGTYDTRADDLFTKFYQDGTLFKKFNQDNWRADYDMGVNVQFLQDDQVPDDAYPVLRKSGHQLRFKHGVARAPPPPLAERPAHRARYVVSDVSRGPGHRVAAKYARSTVVADYDGRRRRLTNVEAMRRPNAITRYSLDQRKGSALANFMPFKDEDKDKPVSFTLRR